MENKPNDAEMRQLLFARCTSKKQLQKWITLFLGLEMPDAIVDEASNSSPMDMIWEAYSECVKAVANPDLIDEDSRRYLYYASRDSFKTLSSSIIEVLCVLHLDRDCCHMAAILEQASKSMEYVKKFFTRPYLRDFIDGDNKRETTIVRYENDKGNILTINEFQAITDSKIKNTYKENKRYIKIVICTMQGANSAHSNFMLTDELEVVSNPKAYSESKAIPAPMDGKLPIVILTSTRKVATGLVQKEIDEAPKSGLKIRHWNLVDVTARCPPTRHLPNEPKISVYYSMATLVTISEDDYKLLPEHEQEKYKRGDAYAGCIRNCKIYAPCKTRLATHQTSKSPLLRPLAHTLSQFKTIDTQMAIAQLLCIKPSSEGLIYPSLDRDVHIVSASKIATMITGDDYPSTFNKRDLINLFNSLGARWAAGMDFGYTHNFAVTLAAIYGNKAFVTDVICAPELEPAQILDELSKIKEFNPAIYADPENPQMIKMIKRAGYRALKWNKNQGSVIDGIETLRAKIRPGLGEPEFFFLEGDEGVDLAFRHLSRYHWKPDAAGRLSDIPDEEDDDLCDSTRYLVLNVFGKGARKVVVGANAPADQSSSIYTKENWARKIIQEQLGDNPVDPAASTGSKGRLKWSF